MKEITAYSLCCEMPILPHKDRLYCHGCNRTVVSIAGSRRPKALAELRWESRWENYVSLTWRNLRVAYARDVPDYVWKNGRYEVVNVTFKWCSAFSIASSLFGFFDGMHEYPGRDNFASFKEAEFDLRVFLVEREGEQAIPKLPKFKGEAVPA